MAIVIQRIIWKVNYLKTNILPVTKIASASRTLSAVNTTPCSFFLEILATAAFKSEGFKRKA